ncbi:MAG: response regulator [Xenococcaceae cyanobacterium]
MIRIILIDDQKIIREGLKVVLKEETDIEIIATADNGKDAVKLVDELRPDVALIDMEMPGINGSIATRFITKHFSETKVLILSSHDSEEYVTKAFRAGAKGYLLKNTPATELGHAIRSIHRGYSQIGPGLFEKIMPNVSDDREEFTIDLLTQVTASGLSVEKENFSLPISTDRYPGKIVAQGDRQAELTSITTATTQEMSWRKVVGVLLVAIGLTTGIYSLRQRLREPVTSLSQSEQTSAIATTEFTGKIKSAKTAKITANNPGIVRDIYVKLGDRVEIGQPLLALKNLDAERELKQAEQQQRSANEQKQQLIQQQQQTSQQIGDLQQKITDFSQELSPLRDRIATADLRLSLVQNRSDRDSVPQKLEAIERTKAIYNNAVSSYKRIEKLQTQGVLSQSKVEEAKAAIEIAQADLNIARADLNSAKNDTAKKRDLESAQTEKSQLQLQLSLKQKQEEIKQLQQQLNQARLNYRQITERLNLLDRQSLQLAKNQTPQLEKIIKATSAGVVTELPHAIGTQIYTDNTLTVITEIKQLKAEVAVNARLINALPLDRQATLKVLTAAGSQQFTGKIVTINPIPLENLSHTVEVQFNNPTNLLLVGQPVAVNFLKE